MVSRRAEKVLPFELVCLDRAFAVVKYDARSHAPGKYTPPLRRVGLVANRIAADRSLSPSKEQ